MNLLPYLLIFALINSCIELEISAPGFPDLMTYFAVDKSIVGLTMTMNLIGFCLAAMVYGPLSDGYGRRKVMLVGNGILAIGASMCVLAPTMSILLLARLIQGFGAATSAVVVSAMIADCYKTEEASRLYGMMNAVFTSLMALAPVLGGLINTAIGWRGNYGVVAAIGIMSWLLLLAFLPETSKHNKPIRIKAIFSSYQTLITNPEFVIAAAIPSMLYGCYMAFVAISPFIYIQTMALSMLVYTINTAIVVVCFAVSSCLSSKITGVFGTQKTLHVALGLQLTGVTLMCFSKTAIHITTNMSLFSIGFALIYPIIFARSMEIYPEIKGTASSVIMSLRYLICASLTFITSLVFDGSILSVAIIFLSVSSLIVALSLFLQCRQYLIQET